MKAPLGWVCNESAYKDGQICDCECGIWDPDCDISEFSQVAALNTEEDMPLLLLDTEQADVTMISMDIDGNRNMVIDGKEDAEFTRNLEPTLVESVLPGLKERIVAAQVAGHGTKGDKRLGSFAWLNAVQSRGCAAMLDAQLKLPEALASYKSVCVKDVQFKKMQGSASGRCAWLPTLKPGSQCKVLSGNALMQAPGEVASNNSVLVENTCGHASSSRRRHSAGVGVTSAKVWDEGKLLTRESADSLGNAPHRRRVRSITGPFELLPPGRSVEQITHAPTRQKKVEEFWRQLHWPVDAKGDKPKRSLGEQGFAFYWEMKCESFYNKPTVMEARGYTVKRWAVHSPIQYGSNPRNFMRIQVGYADVFKAEAEYGDLEFSYCIWEWSHARGCWWHMLKARGVVNLNMLQQWMVTIGEDWMIRLWRDGILIQNMQLPVNPRFRKPLSVSIGEPRTFSGPPNFIKQFQFQGELANIRMWDHEVTWDEATHGKLPSEFSKIVDDTLPDTILPCTPSTKNSWEFVCSQTVLHDRIARRFGYPLSSPPHQTTALQKELLNGVTFDCGSSMSVKAALFDWSMMKGVTREEYSISLYKACAGVPQIKTSTPLAVTTDAVLDFVGFSPWKPNKACSHRHQRHNCMYTHNVTNETTKDPRRAGAHVIRWTGMLIITKSGRYTFEIFAANGAGWFGLDGSSLGEVLETGGYKGRSCNSGNDLIKGTLKPRFCDRRTNRCRGQITKTLELAAGPHALEVIYEYRVSRIPGVARMSYSGPDTDGQLVVMDKVLSKSKAPETTDGKALEVKGPAGYFTFDAANQLAVMPAGSCDLDCKNGLRKDRAAVFRFFCNVTSEMLFEAEVSGTKDFMVWLDDEPVEVMTLGTGADDITSVSSANFTKWFKVGGGGHFLAIQGRPSSYRSVGIKNLRMAAGGEKCKFLLSSTRSLGSETGKQLCSSG